MDPSSILIALEEREKWMERRRKLQDKLKNLRMEKKLLLKELGEIKRRLAKLQSALIPQEGLKIKGRSAKGLRASR